ncbi:MAG: PAS domain S-box protein, partial [Candidatus Cloacimonetes bacterium]|nr:PAS domain S-box protein [Candidatus Cloacimonadota bacterium]
QQHEFLNSVLESISSPLHIINVKDYSIVMANSASSIKLTSDKLTCYKATHNLDMPCSGKEHPCPLQNVMETKTPVTVEHIHIDEKGNKRIFEIHGYPIFDKKGEVIQLIEYSIDITERKKAEQALIESEKKRKTWIENSPVCTKVLDLDFNLQFMSKSGIRELKIDDITEFYGKPYPFHFYPDSFKIPMTKNLQKVKQSGKIIEQEASVLDIDGNELWYHSTIVPVFDDNNKLDYFLVISLEITERKQAEDELLESESLHKEAQRVAHIGHWSLDAITGTPTWSDEIYRIFGLKPGKGAPSFTDHDTIVHPEDFPTLDAAIKKGLSDGTNFDLVFRIIRSKGEIGWMHAIGRSKKDQQGNIIYMFGTAQDVIELKLTEEEMLKTQYYLSKAQEIGKTGSWDLDILKSDLKWTDETYKIFGIPTGKDMTHELFMSCVHPDDRDYLNKSFNNALQKVEPFDIEHRITVNNQVKWLNEKADIKFDTKGNPLFANGFVQDITERKHAEEELRESEKKRSVWIENSPICTKAVDLDFNLMFMSAAGINKLKIDDITKHLGKPYPLSFYPEHYKLSMTESMKKVKETGKSTMHEGSVLDTEGNILWYQSSIVPVYDEKGKLDYILIVSMEITERKLAERSILEAKNRLESIIRNTSAGYFFIDKEGIIQNASDAWVKLYKYDSKEEIIGKHFSVIQQIDDLELANAFVREIMNNNPDYLNGEFSRKCKDGSMGYHNFSANPVYKNYEVIGIEGFIIDITEQKEILLKIQEEQKKNESLLNSIPYPIMLINKKRIVLAANKIALDVGVIVGDYCWKEFGKCECLSDKNLKLSKTNPNEPGIQCTFCRQDEMFETFEPVNNPAVEAFGRIWDTYWIPLNDDEYLHYAIDITEQKEAEQALINSEERFKIMFDYAPDAYYLNDSKGNFIDGNKAAEKLLGYKKEELIGKNFLKFKLIATKELAKASKILLRNIQGKSSGPDELTLLRKDGKQISVEISSYPTRINNQPVVLGIAHDITERNRSRNKLIHYAETQKVLLREVNHRVKNNLSALISMLHKGQDHAEEKGLDSATVLAVMEERIHGLVNVHSMLSHSGWQPIKLSDLCKQIIGESMSSVISTGKVRLIVGKSGVMIGSDLAHHLTMVLNELAMNTLKYALINRDVATITINIKKIKNQVEMCFCDDGPGYPKKLLKGDYSEAGVGFELIQGIVKRSMGGDLQIKNDNGAKTIITFENE